MVTQKTALHNSFVDVVSSFFSYRLEEEQLAETLGARLLAGKLTRAHGNPCLPQSTTLQHLREKEERQQLDARI